MRGGSLAMLDGAQNLRRQPVAPTDDIDPDGLLEAARRLRQKITAQQAEQGAHFRLRPAPIVG